MAVKVKLPMGIVKTVKKWDDFRNYDIVLDSGKLGIDACVDIFWH